MQKKTQGLNINEARKSGWLARCFMRCCLFFSLEQGLGAPGLPSRVPTLFFFAFPWPVGADGRHSLLPLLWDLFYTCLPLPEVGSIDLSVFPGIV